jgi:cation transport regulator ChaC
VEPAVPVRRVATGDAARAAPALLPVLDGVARHARSAGLVLALDRGGTCTGVVYRLPSPAAIDELHLLWRREMVTGSYRPKWVGVRTSERDMVALAFTVSTTTRNTRASSTSIPRRDHRQCAGAFGSSLDYLERTRVRWCSHGIVDRYLERLAAKVSFCARQMTKDAPAARVHFQRSFQLNRDVCGRRRRRASRRSRKRFAPAGSTRPPRCRRACLRA